MKTTASFLFLLLFSMNSPLLLVGQSDSIAADTSNLHIISTHPDIFLTPLPEDVKESSGIIFFRNKIWTHNDSGGNPEIYAIDTATGAIVQTVNLDGAKNVDWEDITQDDHFIYIGDVGNNRGNRKDLKIYKIRKDLIPESGNAEISTFDIISYKYGDQHSFEKRMNRNDFDCESILAYGDSLYLFSKNWADQQTRLYALPKQSGDYTVFPHQTFPAGGLITGAALSPDQRQLALIGYVDFESFMWLFWDFDGPDFFSGQALRINFPDMIFVQTEGICFISDVDVLISCEESAEFPTLFHVNTDSLRMMSENGLGNYFSDKIVLAGMPPEVSRRLRVEILDLPDSSFSFELRNRKWEKLFEGKDVLGKNKDKIRINIKTKDLENGLYFLKINSGDYSLIRKVRIKH